MSSSTKSERYAFGQLFNFSDIFTYEYIEEDFGTDNNNTIWYFNITILKDIKAFNLKKNDKLSSIGFEAATGNLISEGSKTPITVCVSR